MIVSDRLLIRFPLLCLGSGLDLGLGSGFGIWVRVRVRVGGLVRVAIIRIFLGFLRNIFDVIAGGHCIRLS